MTRTESLATDPVDLLLVAGLALAESLLVLIAAAIALVLTLRPAPAHPRPAPREAQPAPLPVVITPEPDLEAMTVRELRAQARAAGLSQLGRSGRRADLLAALAIACPIALSA
jgi:hypothetical protein